MLGFLPSSATAPSIWKISRMFRPIQRTKKERIQRKVAVDMGTSDGSDCFCFCQALLDSSGLNSSRTPSVALH
uniref:Uncharacterized protein n=1 Tax=Aegilops tauschii subsp. strangulata TaxID=200361 RepID=A0A453LA11_AEGTS